MEAAQKAKAQVPKEKLLLGIMTLNETPQTVLAKVGVAKREGLAGIAIWRLGANTAPMWGVFRETIAPKK